ncbi:hypothetical protein OCQ_20330 [Mycobacterium paraintracellulare]|nr:hypothetical protein OCQ_20330 [Mycobacterium paraintracellulare]
MIDEAMPFVSHLQRFELGPTDNTAFCDEFGQFVEDEMTEMQLDFAIHAKSLSQSVLDERRFATDDSTLVVAVSALAFAA